MMNKNCYCNSHNGRFLFLNHFFLLILIKLNVRCVECWMISSAGTAITHNRCAGITKAITCLRQSANDSSNTNILSDLTDKTVYQRVFHSFSPGSDVDIRKSIVIEERVRFEADPDRNGYILPIGPRTLILRDGNVEDGEIGDDFYTIHLFGKHNGAGNDYIIEGIIATALYLASNPSLCSGKVLQVATGDGVNALATLLGCIGAAYVNGEFNRDDVKDLKDDILTISQEHDPIFPKDLERLVISDENVENLELAIKYCQKAGIKKSAMVDQIEWRKRPEIRPRGTSRMITEYRTVIASDISFTYPEAKELARTVANRLESSRLYNAEIIDPNKRPVYPRFVHVCPDNRSGGDIPYLRTFLEKGYRMSTRTGYLKLEQLKFVYQVISNDDAISGDENLALDNLELELHDIKEKKYQSLTAQHHPDYAGGGSGELFFPMETGEYEVSGGSTFLEPEAGSSPW